MASLWRRRREKRVVVGMVSDFMVDVHNVDVVVV